MSLHHGLVEGEYSLHALGGRDAFDPISQILVASSPKGWHCPQVFAVGCTQYLSQRGIALPCLPCKNDNSSTPLASLRHAVWVNQTGMEALPM